MPRNGAGVYSLPALNPVAGGTIIASTWANNTMNDLASALTQSIAANGVTAITANLPMSGFKHTGVATAVAFDQYARASQVQDNAFSVVTAVGHGGTTPTPYTGTLVYGQPGTRAFNVGQCIIFSPDILMSNSGTSTLALNGGAAYGMVNPDGTSATMKVGTQYLLIWSGTQWVVSSPTAGAQFVSTVTGTVNNMNLFPTVPYGSTLPYSGQTYTFFPLGTNTGAVTLGVGFFSKPVFSWVNNPSAAGGVLTGGELNFQCPITVTYNLTMDGWVLQTPPFSAAIAFTPVLKFGGNAVGMTYSNQTGMYIKNGSVIDFWIKITLTAKGSSVGAATISGLPYPLNASYTIDQIAQIASSALTFSAGTLYANLSGTQMNIVNNTTAGAANNLTDTAFSNTTSISIQGRYLNQ